AGESSGVAYGSGGGAGGGYFGGGGGGYTFGDGGGGGSAGSSLGPAGAGFAADTSGTPSVTLTPLALFAAIQPGAASLTFATQAQSTISAPQALTIANAQAATAPLQITGVSFTGADPGDFLIGSSTCGGVVQPGQSCQLTVDFVPEAQGQRTATLEIFGNDPNGPATVGLSGTGGSLPTGPQGTQGPQGPQGAPGPAGPRGASGKIELVTCKTITRKVKRHRRRVQRCTARLVSGRFKFTRAPGSVHATISRNGTVYASGVSVAVGAAGSWMVLSDRRPLTHGRYTLTLRARRRARLITRRLTIAIG
ncbi:MAG: choice-of-anchor D domain-containing protein, partial [Solirubrobacteraceae bacterium]